MRFLLDENISQTVTRNLRRSGFKAVHVLDAGLGGADDEHIFEFAHKKKLTIITHDKDFGNIIRFPVIRHYGVIILRLRNQKPAAVFLVLVNFLKNLNNHGQLKSRLVILSEEGGRII